jgi:predicted nucleic acid-binding protein
MRITLDTNQLVRALVRPPGLATFVMAWEGKRFMVVCSKLLREEYDRVLANPEIATLIYPELLRAFRIKFHKSVATQMMIKSLPPPFMAW